MFFCTKVFFKWPSTLKASAVLCIIEMFRNTHRQSSKQTTIISYHLLLLKFFLKQVKWFPIPTLLLLHIEIVWCFSLLKFCEFLYYIIDYKRHLDMGMFLKNILGNYINNERCILSFPAAAIFKTLDYKCFVLYIIRTGPTNIQKQILTFV